jgi:hypothetical protein
MGILDDIQDCISVVFITIDTKRTFLAALNIVLKEEGDTVKDGKQR